MMSGSEESREPYSMMETMKSYCTAGPGEKARAGRTIRGRARPGGGQGNERAHCMWPKSQQVTRACTGCGAAAARVMKGRTRRGAVAARVMAIRAWWAGTFANRDGSTLHVRGKFGKGPRMNKSIEVVSCEQNSGDRQDLADVIYLWNGYHRC